MSLTQFKATEPVPIASNKEITFDSQYWKGLLFPVTFKEFGAISSISFQPVKPNHFAVSSSNRIIIFDPYTRERVKTYARLHHTVYGATFRSDGKLLVAGSEDGSIRLFDVNGHAPLRTFKGHKMPVRVAQFNSMSQIFSASDDKTVRLWDVACEETLSSFGGHEDYIRTGCSTSPNTIFTGSYDHTIRMHDTRTNATSVVISHGCPVECILAYPSGSVLISAGGNTIKVWDVLQGGRHIASVTHHHKTIMCLGFNHDCTRLLSGGLDKHVKIYDVTNYNVVHNIDYPAPILSLGLSHQDRELAVGMTDKTLSIRRRKQGALDDDEEQMEEEVKLRQRKTLRNHFVSGQTFVANAGDVTINHVERKKLAKYDQYFRKFDHSKSLTDALNAKLCANHPEVTIAVIEELIRRDKLLPAIAGRTGKKLSMLLKFIIKNISNINFSAILIEVADNVIDIYSECAENISFENVLLFRRLHKILVQESKLQLELEKLTGCLQTIVRSNAQRIRFNVHKDAGAC